MSVGSKHLTKAKRSCSYGPRQSDPRVFNILWTTKECSGEKNKQPLSRALQMFLVGMKAEVAFSSSIQKHSGKT